VRRSLFLLLVALLPALVGWSGSADPFTKSDLVIPMDDGVGIGATL
jgi:hypothetical protein